MLGRGPEETVSQPSVAAAAAGEADCYLFCPTTKSPRRLRHGLRRPALSELKARCTRIEDLSGRAAILHAGHLARISDHRNEKAPIRFQIAGEGQIIMRRSLLLVSTLLLCGCWAVAQSAGSGAGRGGSTAGSTTGSQRTPGAQSTTPGTTGTGQQNTPGATTQTPGATSSTPGATTNTPGATTVTPSTAPNEPGATTVTPNSPSTTPEASPNSPSTAPTTPSTVPNSTTLPPDTSAPPPSATSPQGSSTGTPPQL